MYLVVALAITFLCFRYNIHYLVDIIRIRPYFSFIFFFLFCSIYTLIIPAFSKWSFDKTFFLVYFRLFFDLLLVIPVFLCFFFYQLNYTIYDFFNLLVKIGVVQGIFAIILFLIPGARDILYGYILELPAEKLLATSYRGFGLSNDFLFSGPLFQGIVFMINTVLYIKTSKIKYLYYYPFIFAFMVLNARVSLLVIPVFVLVIFCISLYYDNLRWLRKLSGFALFFIVLLIGMGIYFYMNPQQSRVLLWVAEGVMGGLNALSGDIEGSRTLTIIAYEHFHFPKRFIDLMFGEGLVVFNNSISPVKSDLGYIRYLYFGGIMLSLLVYFAFANFSINRILHVSDPLIKTLLISILIITFVVHFKGDVFYSSAYVKGFMLIHAATFFKSSKYDVTSA